MSVRWYDVLVANVTDRTIGLTWVGLPFDAEIPLSVRRVGGVLRIDLDQPQPPLNSDALGADRIPVLEFDQPRAAECHRGGHRAGIPGMTRSTRRSSRCSATGRAKPRAAGARVSGRVGRRSGRTARLAWGARNRRLAMGAGLSSRILGPARSAAPLGARSVAGRGPGGSVRRFRFLDRVGGDRRIPRGSGPPDRSRRVVAHCRVVAHLRAANPRWSADRHQVAGPANEACCRHLAVVPGAAAAPPDAANYRNVAGHQDVRRRLGAAHPCAGRSDASHRAHREGSARGGCAGLAQSLRSSPWGSGGEAPPRCLGAA